MAAARSAPPVLAAVLAVLLDVAEAVQIGTSDATAGRSTGTVGTRSTTRTTTAVRNISTYVINLDKRSDRCRCMQRQIADKALPLYRQSANGVCPDLPKAEGIHHPEKFAAAERSLFCQNYQIWLDANKSDAEHVVILEDDALLAGDFFDRVHSLVTTCQEFDYLVADPGLSVFSRGTELQRRTCPGVFKRKHGFWTGTAVQIVRKSFLPTLIQKAELVGWGAMDAWWQMFIADHRAYAWRGSVNIQASVGKFKRVKTRLQELGCDWSVTSSDIGMGSHHPADHKDGKRTVLKKGAIQPLVCAGA